MASTVGTSTSITAPGYPYQRKCFHAAGRFWVFYSNVSIRYRSSTDGISWSDEATIGSGAVGYNFSLFFDGTDIHYARDYGSKLYYRKGTPQSDGTISWAAAEQTVHTATIPRGYGYATIAVDSNGYAFIGARYWVNSSYYPEVLKNANNDGTWTTDWTERLSTTSDGTWRVLMAALTSTRMYAVYDRRAQAPLGKLWDGSSWGAEESDVADYGVDLEGSVSVTSENDDVHIAYTAATELDIRYNKRTYGVGWQASDELVQGVGANTAPSLSVDTGTGDLYCFWSGAPTSSHVYYKKRTAGGWDADPTDWIDETTDTLPQNDYNTSFYKDYDSYIGHMYIRKAGSPYDVRFDFLTVGAPPPAVISGSSMAAKMMAAGVL